MSCKDNMTKHKFAFGTLTEAEKARGCMGAIVCSACDFRVVTTQKLSPKDQQMAEEIARKYVLTRQLHLEKNDGM